MASINDNIHPRMQFFTCNNIEEFEELINKYGKNYISTIISDRLLDQDNIVFWCQLLVGDYFADMFKFDNDINITFLNESKYNVVKKLLKLNDIDRVKLVIDYLICYIASRYNILLNERYEYKNLSEYENSKIKNLHTVLDRRINPINSDDKLINFKKKLISIFLKQLNDRQSNILLEFILNLHVKYYNDVKISVICDFPNFPSIIETIIVNHNKEGMLIIKKYLYIELIKHYHKHMLDVSINTNNVNILKDVIETFKIYVEYYAHSYCLCPDSLVLTIISMDMYKKIFSYLKYDLNNNLYDFIKYCGSINRADIATFVICNLSC